MLGETVGTILVSGTSSQYLITSTNTTTGVSENHQTRIFHISLSSGTTASTLQITNGQGGAVELVVRGTNNGSSEFDYGIWGHSFSKGAFLVPDVNYNQLAIICKMDRL